jgi:Holliday junction resolvase
MSKSEGQKLSQRQEKDIASKSGGRRTPQSGAGWAIKNDVRCEELLIECKTTVGDKQITIKAVDLEGVVSNALKTGRQGILTFRLHGRDYVVEEWDDWFDRFASTAEEERRP